MLNASQQGTTQSSINQDNPQPEKPRLLALVLLMAQIFFFTASGIDSGLAAIGKLNTLGGSSVEPTLQWIIKHLSHQ
jgi:hypothetical protein